MLKCDVHTKDKIMRSQSMTACDGGHEKFKTTTTRVHFYRLSLCKTPYMLCQFTLGHSVKD